MRLGAGTGIAICLLLFASSLAVLQYSRTSTAASSMETFHLGGSPWGITFDPVNGNFYVANFGYITAVNPVTKVLQNITFPPDNSYGLKASLTDIVYDNATGKLFALDLALPGVWTVDPSTNKVLGSTTLNFSPSSSLTPRFMTDANGRLYVTVDVFTAGKPSYILGLSNTNAAVVANVTLPVGDSPQMSAYDPSNGYLYVAEAVSNQTTVMNAATGAIVKEIPTPANPYAVAYGGGQVFVAESSSNIVAVINASTNAVTGTIQVPQYPYAILYTGDPYIFVFGANFDEVEIVQVQKANPLPPDIFQFSNGLLEMAIDNQLTGGFFCGTYTTNTGSGGGVQCIQDSLSSFTTTTTTTSSTTTTTSTAIATTSTVTKARVTLTTQLQGSVVPNSFLTSGVPVFYAGSHIFDQATLTGATSDAGGTVEYYWNVGTCGGGNNGFNPLVFSKVTVVQGQAPLSDYWSNYNPGQYYFYATYSGDANNGPTVTTCEPFTLVLPPETSTTTGGSGTGAGGGLPFIDWVGIGVLVALLLVFLVTYFIWKPWSKGPPSKVPPVVPPVTPPGGAPPPPPPPPGGGGLKIQAGCTLNHYWDWEKFGLSAAAGGSKAYTKSEHPRLVPVPLAAKGEDSHILVQECHCTDTVTRTWLQVDAIPRFDWEIGSGGGGFVQASGGSGSPTEVGQQALYQPPEIFGVYPEPSSMLEVHIQVKETHDDRSKPPNHGALVLGLRLKITREAKDRYVYEFWPADPVEVKNPVNLPAAVGDCKSAHVWQEGKPISGFIEGPKECGPGDYLRLQAKADDEDKLLMQCIPGVVCKVGDQLTLPMSDVLAYDWTSTGGKFTKVPTKSAREIVWQAPNEEGIADISLELKDTGKEFVDRQLRIGTRVEVRKPASAPSSPAKKAKEAKHGKEEKGEKGETAKEEKAEEEKGESRKGK